MWGRWRWQSHGNGVGLQINRVRGSLKKLFVGQVVRVPAPERFRVQIQEEAFVIQCFDVTVVE